LQEACDDLSPTVVNARIGDLREAKLVELLPGEGYALTPLAKRWWWLPPLNEVGGEVARGRSMTALQGRGVVGGQRQARASWACRRGHADRRTDLNDNSAMKASRFGVG